MRLLTALLSCLPLLVTVAACGGSRPTIEESQPPEPEPIPLGPAGAHPLIFKMVLYRIPAGQVLGEARVGRQVVDELRWSRSSSQTFEFNVAITDRMRDLGYNMRDAADSLFDPAALVQTRFELAGVLHEVELDFEYPPERSTSRSKVGRATADVRLELQLFDAIAKEKIYTRIFLGHGEDIGIKPNPLAEAVVDAVAKAAADPDFVAILSRSAPEKGFEDVLTPVEISECETRSELSLPEDMEATLDSIVTIRVGAVSGTGVIVSSDGWVLSAEHVVGDDNEIWVRLRSGIEVPANLVRADKRLDLALLRLSGRGYPCSRPRLVEDALRLGSDVFAVSALHEPAGRPTISRGVVSGYPEKEGIRFIQTDASVNPGSSGGPLLSSDGSIAGIVVRKVAGIGLEGIGYAIPMNTVVEGLSLELSQDRAPEPR